MGMTPIKIQHAVQSLEPMKVKYSQRRSQCESLVHFASLVALVTATYVFQLSPLTDAMLSLKNELCGGNQTFVIGFNPSTQLTHALVTPDAQQTFNRNLTVSELAVDAHKATSPETTPAAEPTYLLFSTDKATFNIDNTRSIEAEGGQIPFCVETAILNEDAPYHEDTSLNYWTSALIRTAAATVGLNHARSCREMLDQCNAVDSRLLRMVCGETCGCTSPYSTAWFKVPAQGCAPACLQQAQSTLSEGSCEDKEVDEDWRSFWTLFPDVVSYYYGADVTQTLLWPAANQTIEAMLKDGCAALTQFPQDVMTNAMWCMGMPELFRPLAAVCPQTCGCNRAANLPSYCPSSCMTSGNSSA